MEDPTSSTCAVSGRASVMLGPPHRHTFACTQTLAVAYAARFAFDEAPTCVRAHVYHD